MCLNFEFAKSPHKTIQKNLHSLNRLNKFSTSIFYADLKISPPQTWRNPESKQESDWKVPFFERPYTVYFSSYKDAQGMKNVLRVPKFLKIIFSKRSETWFAPPGTPERQKILSVWLSHKKNTKNASFFKSGRGHPRWYQHIIWLFGSS